MLRGIELTRTNRSFGLTILIVPIFGGSYCRDAIQLRTDWKNKTVFPVVLARGKHPFPFRTRPLSPSAPMVLHGGPCGRVGRRRELFINGSDIVWAISLFISFFHSHSIQKFPLGRCPGRAALTLPLRSRYASLPVCSASSAFPCREMLASRRLLPKIG